MRSLSSMIRDTRGNVMFLTAASMFALVGMGGGALDAGRLYLSKSRLQQACDAGVLAYRRSMQGTNVVSTTYPTAQKYFYANYTPGKYGTSDPVFPQPTVDANVVVHGNASVTVPMTLMKIFNFSQVALSVSCDAQLQLPNTDVMFVLDTTGSMTEVNTGDSTDKITALRNAVINFYNTLENAKIAGTQIRYGFVPYSNTVNVGLLLKRDWMADSADYQSRRFLEVVPQPDGTQPNEKTTNSGWSPDNSSRSTYAGDPENCVAPANTAKQTNYKQGAWSPSDTALPRSRTNTRTYGGDVYSAKVQSNGQCLITKVSYPPTDQSLTETVSANPQAGQPITTNRYKWRYDKINWPISGLKGNAADGLMASGGWVDFPVNNPAANSSTPSNYRFTFNATSACIEERQTVRPGETGTAYDMDVDSAPVVGRPETQWKPFIPQIVFARAVTNYSGTPKGWKMDPDETITDYTRLSSLSSLYNACPSAARKLQSAQQGLTASALSAYLNSLATRGWTYHDIGFLWGLRLISKEGLFASENAAAPNGSAIARNIIFMTDGDTETHFQAYDAYGLSALDRRRTAPGSLPTDSDQDSIVESRLTTYCNVAKNQKGMTVWVIAFGTTLTPLLEGCASQGRAFQANNTAELNQTFADIAARIAQLRITR